MRDRETGGWILMLSTNRSIARPSAMAIFALPLVLAATAAHATPSSTVWTNMTLDLQPYGVVHLGVDNYTTVFRKASAGGGSFPTDYGVTVGVLPFEKFQMELGVDFIEATDHPVFFNLKMGAPEGALFDGAPALQVGLFNVGTKKDVTDQNVVDLVVGKSFAGIGSIVHVGGLQRADGAQVDLLISILDREEGAVETLREHNVRLISVFKASEFVTK